jgi:hypothetical protein
MAEVSAEKLVARLASGKPVPAIVLIGTDAYLSDLCRKQIIEACVPEAARDWAVARIRGDVAGWDEALERVQTMPMLAPRQVIIVEDAQLIEKLGDESRDEIIKALTAYRFSVPLPFAWRAQRRTPDRLLTLREEPYRRVTYGTSDDRRAPRLRSGAH